MSKPAGHLYDSGARKPDLVGESLANKLAGLKTELAAKARRLEHTQGEVAGLECRLLLFECLQSAQLLTATLLDLVQTANEQRTLPPEWKRSRIQNCKRAIASALLWVGKG